MLVLRTCVMSIVKSILLVNVFFSENVTIEACSCLVR